jgi:hypothetical protein
MDNKEIEQAFTDFENDDFLSAKDKLKKQILKHKNAYLKNKLSLKNDIVPTVQEK